jgi:hypothetical protein
MSRTKAMLKVLATYHSTIQVMLITAEFLCLFAMCSIPIQPVLGLFTTIGLFSTFWTMFVIIGCLIDSGSFRGNVFWFLIHMLSLAILFLLVILPAMLERYS